ncbi:MAG: hypothetical protein JXA66_00315 [Oligoflexia bacterium]|nr:hypothetical protein [Oligoflexia bacterium]
MKPAPVKKPDTSVYKDPLTVIKETYSALIWKELEEQKDFSSRFEVVKQTMRYNPEFESIYREICSSVEEYMASRVDIDELLTIIGKGVELYNNEQYVICYLKVLRSVEGFARGIDFLKELDQKTSDPYKKAWYLEAIRGLQHERNILFLTRAVEKYYQANKIFPGDLSVLEEAGIIDEIPEEPYGGQYFIAKQGQIRSTSERGGKSR